MSVSKYLLDVSTAVVTVLALLIPVSCCPGDELPSQRVKTYVEKRAGMAFTDHDLFQRTTVRSKLDCARKCASNEDCRSYSYSVSSDGTSRTCSGHSQDRTASDPVASSPGTQNFITTSGMPAVPTETNVALGKTASQSSTLMGWIGGDPMRAVDGDHGPVYMDGSCSHTSLSGSPMWWQVDLGQSYSIQSVIITNRASEPWRLHDFDIDVYPLNPESDPQAPASLCHHQTGSMSQRTQTFSCTCSPLAGRFVRITNGGAPLTLCEVEVWAFSSP